MEAARRRGATPMPEALPAGWQGGPACGPLPASLPPAARLHLFTSGTTGAPKLIGKALHHLLAEVEVLEACFGPRMGDAPVLASVSMQHIYGLLHHLLWPLAKRRPILPHRCTQAADLAELLPRLAGRQICLLTTPTFLARLRSAAFRPPPQRLVICAGAELSPTLADWAQQTFACPLVDLLGSTETGGIAQRHHDRGTVAPFVPLPGVICRVVGGRLAVKSPFVAGSGALITSDAAQGRGDGFELRGRVDRIIKIHDKAVDLQAMEGCLLTTTLVTTAVATARGSGAPEICCQLSPAGRALQAAQGLAAVTEALRRALLADTLHAAVPEVIDFI